MREVVDIVVGLGGLEEALEEDERGGDREVELKRVEDDPLHLQDLLPRVGLVRDVHEVADLTWRQNIDDCN